MKKLVILSLIILSAGIVQGQNFIETSPDKAGLLEDRLTRIDGVIEKAIAENEIPGAIALIARKGNIGYYKCFGYADVDSKTKMKKDAIFRIASMSKAITTVGIMILHEQGYFQLNDPVSKYIPAFKSPNVINEVDSTGKIVSTQPSEKEIRIIDLMSHSSGITYPFSWSNLSRLYRDSGIVDGLTGQDLLLGDQMLKLAELPLKFVPGSSYEYGLSIDLLGYLIEVVSGKNLDEFLRDEIFVPLKMKDSYFYLPENKAGRLVTLYSATEDGLIESDGTLSALKLDNVNYPVEGARSYYSGGGGLSSTTYDYARFIQMLLNEGELEGVRLLSRKSVELLRAPRIDWNDDGKPDFALGFRVDGDGGETGNLGSKGTYSWGGAFYTRFWIDPAEDLIILFMSQVLPAKTDVSDQFRTAVYQSLK